MRLFIAVKLSETIENALLTAQDALRMHQITGNYTECKNLHLTLAFIGEQDAPSQVLNALKPLLFEPFSLSLSGKAGEFGEIWWAGVKYNPELMALASKVRKALAENRIFFDRKPFRPHITLLRKAKIPFGKVFDIRQLKLAGVSMIVDRISLMHSHRENGKLVYTELDYIQAQDGRRKNDV